jgi:hypothetical protein
MVQHKFDSQKMICTGMVLSLANDLRPPGKFNFLQNIRILTEGVLQSRPRIAESIALSPASTQIPHSIKTINDKVTDTLNRIVGADARIYTGSGSVVTEKVTGFSGDPLSIVDFRPEESIEAYAYIADRLKMCKISVSNVASDIGINAATKAATFSIVKPARKIIDNITTAGVGNWNNLTGSAGVPAAETRINTTILAILYDGAAPNFASIVPTAFPPTLQQGCIVTLNGADEAVVEEILPSTLLAGVATITAISYDTGTTGLCTIVLSVPDVSIKRNSILLLGGTEYVKVEEVTRDINSIPSVRVRTVGTFAATNTVSGKDSFRVYAVNTYAATQAIFAEGLVTAIGAAGISSITRTFNVDLTNADSRPLKDDDLLHCSLKVSDQSAITEIQVQVDYDSATNDFTRNYAYYVITPNFFISSADQDTSTLSTIQQTLQREELVNDLSSYRSRYDFYNDYNYNSSYDYRNYAEYDNLPTYTPVETNPTSPVGQTNLGQSQWTEFFIRLKDLIRSGSDETRTLKDIKAIRISVNAKAAVTIGLDSIWVGGGRDLDSIDQMPYNYIWRARDKATGNPSNWSPPLREGIHTSRNSISILPTGASVDFPSTYVIDIARHGGSLNDYRIVGTINNNGSAFVDNVSNLTAALNDPAGRRLTGNQIGSEEVFDFYKPFTFLDTPKSGVCSVIGTKFTRISGDVLNTTYPRGVQILINGQLNRFYTNPTTTSNVELEKDMGSLSNVAFEIKTPLLTGQPLPMLAGTFGEGNSGLFLFATGNKKAAGTIYWTDGNVPDTQSDLNFLEITSPSEPVLAIVIYDGYGFAFSTERSFMIVPTFDQNGIRFFARESANSRGVFSPWSITVGRDYIYYLTENADGIVRVAGSGNPQSITDGSLYSLFPHNGINPVPITLLSGAAAVTIQPPNFELPEAIRLYSCKDFMFFRYIDIIGNHVCLVFDQRINDWISYDTYADNKVNIFYAEEMESTSDILVGITGGIGKFVESTVATAREDTLKSIVIPFSADQGDSRILKRYDEIVFDAIAANLGFDYTVFYNNGTSIDSTENVSATATRAKIAKAIADGTGTLARNIGCKLEWRLSSPVRIFEQQYYFIPRADQINDRASDEEDGGVFGDKYFQGITIEADTFGEDKELIFVNDAGVTVANLTINHSGMQTRTYSFADPFIAQKVMQTSVDGVEWIFYKSVYKFDVEPNLGKVWEIQETSFGIPGFKVIERIGITIRSTAVSTLEIYYDDIVETYNLVSTAGDKEKISFFVKARKGKLIKFRLESEQDVRVYEKDFEVWIRQYNLPNFYQPIQPFGGKDYLVGAQI